MLAAAYACQQAGVRPSERIELWHHLVDGAPHEVPDEIRRMGQLAEMETTPEGKRWFRSHLAAKPVARTPIEDLLEVTRSTPQITDLIADSYQTIYDWPITEDYCRVTAAALGLPLLFSWRKGGILRGALRFNESVPPVYFQRPDGSIGQNNPQLHMTNTRMRLPQTGANLQTRWCSAWVKIEVMEAALANDPRFRGKKILVITGERRQESANRASYPKVQWYRNKPVKSRTVHHWRPILDNDEASVWAMLQAAGIVPHPCYYLGLSRCSCMVCIFLDRGELATINNLDPHRIGLLTRLEFLTGRSLARSGEWLQEKAQSGEPLAAQFPVPNIRAWSALAKSNEWPAHIPVRVTPESWTLPSGAFKGGGGPS